MKTNSLSVRVTDDDAAFLARLDVPGAATPSEKLRALLRAEQDRCDGSKDPIRASEVTQNMLLRARHELKVLEAETGMRSNLVREVYDRLPDIMGRILVGVPQGPGEKEKRAREFEAALALEIFDLLHVVVELGASPKNRVYDASQLEERLEGLLDYVALIMSVRKRKEKE